MSRITAIRRGSGSEKRVNVFVDGLFLLALDEEVASKAGIQVGQELSQDQIEDLRVVDIHRNCLAAALHYLSYRPRSENEVRSRLHKRGFDSGVVDEIISELKEQKLVDDAVFARYWKDERLAFNPRSRSLVKYELRQKGVNVEIAEEVAGGLDDEASACEAARRKVRALADSDYGEFHRRLSGYLRRRGFSYEVINCVVARLWREQKAASDAGSCIGSSLDTDSAGDYY